MVFITTLLVLNISFLIFINHFTVSKIVFLPKFDSSIKNSWSKCYLLRRWFTYVLRIKVYFEWIMGTHNMFWVHVDQSPFHQSKFISTFSFFIFVTKFNDIIWILPHVECKNSIVPNFDHLDYLLKSTILPFLLSPSFYPNIINCWAISVISVIW